MQHFNLVSIHVNPDQGMDVWPSNVRKAVESCHFRTINTFQQRVWHISFGATIR